MCLLELPILLGQATNRTNINSKTGGTFYLMRCLCFQPTDIESKKLVYLVLNFSFLDFPVNLDLVSML
jgi:hypothetical protein